MNVLHWADVPHLGIPQVDDEHQKLLNLVAAFQDAVMEQRGADVLCQTLDEVVAYTSYHFRHEEELFAASSYPQTEEHKAAHRALAAQVCDIQGQLRFGVTERLAQQLFQFLRFFFSSHVRVMDFSYVPYVKRDEGPESEPIKQ